MRQRLRYLNIWTLEEKGPDLDRGFQDASGEVNNTTSGLVRIGKEQQGNKRSLTKVN